MALDSAPVIFGALSFENCNWPILYEEVCAYLYKLSLRHIISIKNFFVLLVFFVDINDNNLLVFKGHHRITKLTSFLIIVEYCMSREEWFKQNNSQINSYRVVVFLIWIGMNQNLVKPKFNWYWFFFSSLIPNFRINIQNRGQGSNKSLRHISLHKINPKVRYQV